MDLQEFARQENRRSELFYEVITASRDLLKYHPEAEEARAYLKNRISVHSLEKFDFGYFPSDDGVEILAHKVGYETLLELGLIFPWRVQNGGQIVQIYRSFFNHHNVLIPFKDEYGNIVSLVGRTLLDNDLQKKNSISKYKYTPFYKGLHLFGLYNAKRAIRKQKSVILVEGQIDCINCHSHGFYNVVGLGGAALTKFQFYLLKKYTENIYLLLDNDLAGKKAEDKIINRYSKLAKFRKIELPPEYKDVDEYLKNSATMSIFDSI